MEHSLHELIIAIVLFAGFFLASISLIQTLSNKFSFPYTVAILFYGFLAQLVVHFFHLDFHLVLPPELIYYLLLPLLLFESCLHINVHQFRLQFKTISFLSTFGLLVSIFVLGIGVNLLLGLPLAVALLFGALISATDPIAVIALFKTLGAPKRLGLVADGESMFNDATAVIAFRLISTFALTGTAFGASKIIFSLGDFFYVVIGSIIFGAVAGYITAKFIERVKNDPLIETTLTLALALFSFVGAEYFFTLSGVISTVIAGIVMGNLGQTKVSQGVFPFIKEWWGYIAFVSVSLVFFFASFNLNVNIFSGRLGELLLVVALVLIARAASVYGTVWLSNNLSFFKDEPNIPMSWQHILNWGGLRGVIPLVLVYSLPNDFQYRDDILAFTLATLVFTIIVNGLTIKWLLVLFKLHLPEKEEAIMQEETNLFHLIEQQEKLKHLSRREFGSKILTQIGKELTQKETLLKKQLQQINPTDFYKSLQLQALSVERETLHELFYQGRFSEPVFYLFDSELDIQQDAIEYPENNKVIDRNTGGPQSLKVSFRKRLLRLRGAMVKFPFLRKILHINVTDLVRERTDLLRARIITSQEVLNYLKNINQIFHKAEFKSAIRKVERQQREYIAKNEKEARSLLKKYPHFTQEYQQRVIYSLINEQLPTTLH